MNLTVDNFDTTLFKKIQEIDNYFPKADNFEIAVLCAHKTALQCMIRKGYSYINANKNEINDCNTCYLNYNTLSWQDLLIHIFPTIIGGEV
jgi:hypothetical protein